MDTKISTEVQTGQLCVQVHPARAPELNIAAPKEAADSLARSTQGVQGIGFTEGEDDGEYLNIVFASPEPLLPWRQIRAGLFESPAFGSLLKKSSMAMCTGADGWNDYMLLYHYDPEVPVDAASDA
jgi:hypothetical protein